MVENMSSSATRRIVIENVRPEIDGGRFPIKRVKGECVTVSADVFADGHAEIFVLLLFKRQEDREWQKVRMKSLGNDLWESKFRVEENVNYCYTVQGFMHDFDTWRKGLQKKVKSRQDVDVDLMIGVQILKAALPRVMPQHKSELKKWIGLLRNSRKKEDALEAAFDSDLLYMLETYLDPRRSTVYEKELIVLVEDPRASFSSWYEFFPRSWGKKPGQHGTFKDCQQILPAIKDMGFNVIYLPPIHPIGQTKRKGKNNAVVCRKGDPGSPWAIGSKEGGHKSIHPQLGDFADFQDFVACANKLGLEVAIDLAFQCSPDHPYVKAHPKWFKWRPDGVVQYAENPPKKYEDILPLNFETDDRQSLWQELKSIVFFWIEKGVSIFRVDNPHTKPFVFWDWLIAEVKKAHPQTIFLAEAFTRPKVMYRLAKGGFTQSYTYFTWRHTKSELMEYLTELTQTEVGEFFRPNFWPNTPDILVPHLQEGGRPAFIMRVVLASMLSANFGIYGPVFELCLSKSVSDKEEYIDSEKYEIKAWDWDRPGNIKSVITTLNMIRRENPSLQQTRKIRFLDINNDQLLCFYKATEDYSNIILVAVNLNPFCTESGWLRVPIDELGLDYERPYIAHDLLNEEKYVWQGDGAYIELDPQRSMAHVIRLDHQST